MSSFLRFFHEHLKRFLPLIVCGSLLLTLAGACQGLMIGLLRFVLDDSLAMGGGQDPTGMTMQVKAWLFVHLPSAANVRQQVYLVPAALVLVFILKGVFTYSGTLLMVRSGIRATLALRERISPTCCARSRPFSSGTRWASCSSAASRMWARCRGSLPTSSPTRCGN